MIVTDERAVHYSDVLEATNAGHPADVSDASLDLLHQRWHEWLDTAPAEVSHSFGLLTSWRSGLDRQTNLEAAENRRIGLRQPGVVPWRVLAHFEDGHVEPWLFVFGISRRRGHRIARRHEQPAWYFCHQVETSGDVHLVQDVGDDQNVGEFSPSVIVEAVAQLRGGSNCWFSLPPHCWGEAVMADAFVRRAS